MIIILLFTFLQLLNCYEVTEIDQIYLISENETNLTINLEFFLFLLTKLTLEVNKLKIFLFCII